MAIRDHEFDPAQAAAGELAQELRPEGLCLRRSNIHAEQNATALPGGVQHFGDS